MNKKSVAFWVVLGCGGLVALFVGFVAVMFFVIMYSMRSTTPFQDGLARAQADPRVVEALGAPIEPGWFMSGKIQTSGQSGSCDIDIPLKGSKQDGSVHVVGTREGGRWSYERMIMTPGRGDPIDLIAGSPRTATQAE